MSDSLVWETLERASSALDLVWAIPALEPASIVWTIPAKEFNEDQHPRHEGSRRVTGAAAAMMGISGYEKEESKVADRLAGKFLDSIATEKALADDLPPASRVAATQEPGLARALLAVWRAHASGIDMPALRAACGRSEALGPVLDALQPDVLWERQTAALVPRLTHCVRLGFEEGAKPLRAAGVRFAKGGQGSGNFGHAGRPGEVGGSGEGGAAASKVWSDDFNITSLNPEGQRFMVHPKSLKVFIGDKDAETGDGDNGDNASHAEEFADNQARLGLPGKYDDYVKGWAYGADADYPEQSAGRINFYSKAFSDDAEKFDAYANAAEAFVKSGHATADTRVDGLVGALGYGMSFKRTLGAAFPYLFETGAKRVEMRAAQIDELKGGAGSGNFGHEGRPGEVGGSGSGGSAGGRGGGGSGEGGSSATSTSEKQATLIASIVGDTWYHASTSTDLTHFDNEKIKGTDYDAPYTGIWLSTDAMTSPAMINPNALYVVQPLNVEKVITRPEANRFSRALKKEDGYEEKLRASGAKGDGDYTRMRLIDAGYSVVLHNEKPVINVEELERTGKTEFTLGWRPAEMRKELLWAGTEHETVSYDLFQGGEHITGFGHPQELIDQEARELVILDARNAKIVAQQPSPWHN